MVPHSAHLPWIAAGGFHRHWTLGPAADHQLFRVHRIAIPGLGLDDHVYRNVDLATGRTRHGSVQTKSVGPSGHNLPVTSS
jgi:hypothetical protein